MNNPSPLTIAVFMVMLWSLIAVVPAAGSINGEQGHAEVTQPASDHDSAAPQSEGHDEVESQPNQGHGSHGGDISGVPRLVRWLGKFHPLMVHFPIALLLVAAVAELLKGLLGAQWLGDAARFCVLVGAGGAVAAASLGWMSAAFADYSGDMAWTLQVHRWLGTTTAVLSIMIAVLCEVSARSNNQKYRRWYLTLLFVGAALVGVTGHFGGTLIFGRGYYSW